MRQPDNPPRTVPGLRLLFVCSGNTCRSPLAEVLAPRIARKLGVPLASARSSGTSTVPGLPASDGARRAAQRHGLSLEAHRSSPISSALVEEADLVLAMGPSHLRRVVELGAGSKARLLGAFAEGREGEEVAASRLAVPDPFGGDDEVYEETYRTLEELVEQALRRLAEDGGQAVGEGERSEREGDS